MAEFLASGRVLDWILVGMALEGAGLVALWRTAGRGVRPGALLPNLFSGMALLLAMRVGLAGGWWGWVGLALLAALIGHLSDLRRRWNFFDKPPPSGRGEGEGGTVPANRPRLSQQPDHPHPTLSQRERD